MTQTRFLTFFAIALAISCLIVASSCGSTSNSLPTSRSSSQVTSQSTTTGSLTFSNDALLRPEGGSEPAISIGANALMGITSLRWLLFGTDLWTGPAGSVPTFRGVIDEALQPHGNRTVLGGGDADLEIGSTGTLHETSLIFLVNPAFNNAQLGVAYVRCAGAVSFDLSSCTSRILDQAGADRQWITTDGSRVYLSYHDAGNSTLIRVQRSDDDGLTWQKVGNPIVGQGRTTGSATFNNTAGPIVADPFTHNVYSIYTAGEPGIQKATSANHNNVFVSRSTDFGETWTSVLVFHAPLFTPLNNVFPALAVDPTNGHLYATWSDGKIVSFSASSDQGQTWSTAVSVNVAPANMAIFPWVAAYNGVVDLVYYGTTAASNSSGAVWNVYLAQTTNAGASFAQSLVSHDSNHTGVICTEGIACAAGTRNLLDLFEVAINPQTGLASIAYTDDKVSTTSTGDPLPQIVLAQQAP